MSMKWSHWLVIGGLAVDLVDAFTTKSGTAGGVFYGPNGYLAQFNTSLPGGLHPGELAAMVGAGFMFMHHRG